MADVSSTVVITFSVIVSVSVDSISDVESEMLSLAVIYSSVFDEDQPVNTLLKIVIVVANAVIILISMLSLLEYFTSDLL